MKRLCYITVILVALATSACTTQIHSDYPQYLVNNQADVAFPHVANSVQYYLDPATENHSVSIRSFMAGAANSWTVQFGRVMDATMSSNQIKSAFDSVEKTISRESADGLLLVFSLHNYQFSEFKAMIALEISVYSGGGEILSKIYNATGISQGGKMFWGGAFAMKNAVQQSTKYAVDMILIEFIRDLKVAIAGQASSGGSWTNGTRDLLAPVYSWFTEVFGSAPHTNGSERGIHPSTYFRKVTNGFRSDWRSDLYAGHHRGLSAFQETLLFRGVS